MYLTLPYAAGWHLAGANMGVACAWGLASFFALEKGPTGSRGTHDRNLTPKAIAPGLSLVHTITYPSRPSGTLSAPEFRVAAGGLANPGHTRDGMTLQGSKRPPKGIEVSDEPEQNVHSTLRTVYLGQEPTGVHPLAPDAGAQTVTSPTYLGVIARRGGPPPAG